jgi:hypothetical protein
MYFPVFTPRIGSYQKQLDKDFEYPGGDQKIYKIFTIELIELHNAIPVSEL